MLLWHWHLDVVVMIKDSGEYIDNRFVKSISLWPAIVFDCWSLLSYWLTILARFRKWTYQLSFIYCLRLHIHNLLMINNLSLSNDLNRSISNKYLPIWVNKSWKVKECPEWFQGKPCPPFRHGISLLELVAL